MDPVAATELVFPARAGTQRSGADALSSELDGEECVWLKQATDPLCSESRKTG